MDKNRYFRKTLSIPVPLFLNLVVVTRVLLAIILGFYFINQQSYRAFADTKVAENQIINSLGRESEKSLPEKSGRQTAQLSSPEQGGQVEAKGGAKRNEKGLRIANFVFARSVENRSPAGEGTAFHFSVGRVYTWMEIENASPPTTLKHIYYFKNQKILEIELEVKYSHMKLWSYKNISENIFAGKWRVDITDKAGNVLARGVFEITE